MKTLLCYLPQTLSNPLSPTSLSPPTSTPTVFSVVLLLWLNGWSCHIWCAILLNNNMDLHMSSLGTRRTLTCVLCKNESGLPRSDICSFLLVLWFDITNTQTHIQHTQRPVDWHTHINEYLHHLLCAQSSYLYYIKWLNFVLKEN